MSVKKMSVHVYTFVVFMLVAYTHSYLIPFDPTNCQNCIYDEYGIGFLPDLGNVCNYIRCQKVGTNYTKIVMPCPEGTSWNQTLLTCVHDIPAECPGLCKDNDYAKYSMGEVQCRTYIYCDPAAGMHLECCPVGQRFDDIILDCVDDVNKTCNDPCGVCTYVTDSDCANEFWNHGIKQHCGPDQHFNDTDGVCTCVPVDNCDCCPEPPECDFQVPMDGNYYSPDGWVYPPADPVNCLEHPDGCNFTTNQYLTTWAFANAWNGASVESMCLEFELKPELLQEPTPHYVQGVLTNGNCWNAPPINITYNSFTSLLVVKMNGAEAERQVYLPIGQWTFVRVYYDVDELIVVVDEPACPHAQKITHTKGHVSNTYAPLLIGSGFVGEQCEPSSFNGWMKNLCFHFNIDNPFTDVDFTRQEECTLAE